MKKIFSMLVICLLFVSACSSSSSDSESSEGIPLAASPVEPEAGDAMTVVGADDTSEGACLQNALDTYSDEYGVEINYIEAPYEDAMTKIQNLIRSGDQPDLVRLSGFTPLGTDNLVDMSELTDMSVFNESLLTQGQSADGEQVALPMNLTANGFFYNKELFEEAGIDVPTFDDPWTWDEFEEASDKLMASGADAAYVMDYSQFRLATLYYTLEDQAMFDTETKEVIVNSPENIEVVDRFVQDLIDGTSTTATWVSSEDPSAVFETGTVGMYLAGNWKIEQFSDGLSFDHGVMPMPDGGGGSNTNIGMNYFYEVRDSENQETASHFVSWIYEPENYSTFVSDCSYLPATSNVGDINYDLNEQGEQDLADFTEQSTYVNPLSAADNTFTSTTFVGDNLIREQVTAAANGEKTTEEALNEAAQAMLDEIHETDEEWTLRYPVSE